MPPLLGGLYELCCEPEEDEVDDDDVSVHRYAAQALESASEDISSKHLMPALLEQAPSPVPPPPRPRAPAPRAPTPRRAGPRP